MKIEYKNLNEKIITYQLGKSIIKITEKKDALKNQDNNIKEFQSINSTVRSHEQIHMAALGQYAGSIPAYNFITGPDGKSYAGGGSIKVDMSPVPGNPEATLSKANTILYASMATGNPSDADKSTAEKAFTLALQAKKEINKKQINSIHNENLNLYKENYLNSKPSNIHIINIFA
jgi:hypothetical protein